MKKILFALIVFMSIELMAQTKHELINCQNIDISFKT